jgi:hypothetical protein
MFLSPATRYGQCKHVLHNSLGEMTRASGLRVDNPA